MQLAYDLTPSFRARAPANALVFKKDLSDCKNGSTLGVCPQGRSNRERSKTIAPKGLVLLLLLVDSVSLRNWVEFLRFILLTWVFLVLVIKTSVVGMTFPNAVFIAE